MKRPARPFVVEVKKKRGSPAKRLSIWGDLGLSALSADHPVVTELASEPAGNDRDPDPAVEVDCASDTGSAIETPSENGDAHAMPTQTTPNCIPLRPRRKVLPMGLCGRLEKVADA